MYEDILICIMFIGAIEVFLLSAILIDLGYIKDYIKEIEEKLRSSV